MFVTFLFACQDNVALRAPGDAALVAPDAWAPLRGVDPFAPLGDPNADCLDTAWGPEDLTGEWVFSVDTLDCGRLTVAQPALVDLRAGDEIAIRLWHFPLVGPEGATANLGIAIDGEVIWREVLPIPSDGALLTPVVSAPSDSFPGAEVAFHVSNHGSNSYSLIAVERVIR
jgi:hypothetical protein